MPYSIKRNGKVQNGMEAKSAAYCVHLYGAYGSAAKPTPEVIQPHLPISHHALCQSDVNKHIFQSAIVSQKAARLRVNSLEDALLNRTLLLRA